MSLLSSAASADLIGQTTAIVKAFERPVALHRLVRSLKRHFPDLKILVLDDSLNQYAKPPGVEYIRTEPDIGVSAGRNRLLQRVTTPLFWQLDDDFEATRKTRIELLARPVADQEADIVAGDAVRCKRKWLGWIRTKPSPFFGRIQRRQGVLRLTPGTLGRHGDYYVCDIVPQFFVARTETFLDMGGWDEDLKTEEHEELFVRCQERGLRVWYHPDVQIRHWSELPANYAPYRRRSYRPLAARKMGVHTWIDMDGKIIDFKDARAA